MHDDPRAAIGSRPLRPGFVIRSRPRPPVELPGACPAGANLPKAGWTSSVRMPFYASKRRAAAVLGHRLRPGDLPSDTKVREQLVARRDSTKLQPAEPMPEPDGAHRLPWPIIWIGLPSTGCGWCRWRSVKQNPKYHPEGDCTLPQPSGLPARA